MKLQKKKTKNPKTIFHKIYLLRKFGVYLKSKTLGIKEKTIHAQKDLLLKILN